MTREQLLKYIEENRFVVEPHVLGTYKMYWRANSDTPARPVRYFVGDFRSLTACYRFVRDYVQIPY